MMMWLLLVIIPLTIFLIPAYADVTPLKQWNNGIPLELIRCTIDKFPVNLAGRPVCASPETSNILAMRGYQMIDADLEGYTGQMCKGLVQIEYEILRDLNYNMTEGKFVALCINPERLWYVLHLDTTEPGSITLEIPKDKINLKQFDYLDCKPSHRSDGPAFTHVTAEQLYQSFDSRMIKFSYDEPVSRIIYHEEIGKFEQPRSCIERYQQERHSPVIHLPWNVITDPKEANPSSPYEEGIELYEIPRCNTSLNLNYEITGGRVLYMCSAVYSDRYDNGTRGIRSGTFYMILSNINSLEYITVDVPWTAYAPIRPESLGDISRYMSGNIKSLNPDKCIAVEVIARTQEHQTYKIPVGEGQTVFRLQNRDGYYPQPLDVFINNIVPFNNTDSFRPTGVYSHINSSLANMNVHQPDNYIIYSDFIVEFDKRIDGRYVGECCRFDETNMHACIPNWPDPSSDTPRK